MESREDEIKGLKTLLAERELERRRLPVDDLDSRLALTKEITIKEERLFWMEKQGNFASPISVVLSHSIDHLFLPTLFRHLLFTHPVAANAQGKR